MIFRSCTRSLRRDLIFIKSSSNWKGQTFQRVSNQRTPPRTLSNQRHTSKSHQVRIRKRSAFHIPGKAWEGIAAARGMLARSSSNVNCKNNSSDCELAHPVRLKYSLKSFLRRRKRWQIRSQGGEIRHSKPRTGTETPCTGSLELHLSVLICAALCRTSLPEEHRSPKRAEFRAR